MQTISKTQFELRRIAMNRIEFFEDGKITFAPNDDKSELVTNVVNKKGSTLPSTGGIGTTIFTIGGCAIMIVAAGLFFATRRKTQK